MTRDSSQNMEIERMELEEVVDLRTREFRPLLYGIKEFRIDKDEHPDTRHFGVRDGQVVIAALTFFRDPLPIEPEESGYRLFGCAVDEEYRGEGIGHALCAAALEALAREFPEVTNLWGYAQLEVRSFWERFGFEPWGDVQIMRGQPHLPMTRRLAACRGENDGPSTRG